MTDRVGQQLGNYQIVELLGKGGFADVYLGQHRYLQSYAALKVLRQTLNEDDEQQFLLEAQTLVRLRHPHIVRVLDFAVEQGTPVLIMEYAPQGTLRKHYPSGIRLPLATIVEFVMQIASALQYAHNHHVIHRDIKPENILLDADHRLLISDFGLSLLSPSPDLLSTQEPAGTFPYTAPEQLRGKPCFASDQYALGIITYEWLCGKRPFEGKALELMHHHLYTLPPLLRDFYPTLPVAVETVILRALAKEPTDRFVSVQAFAQALARASQQQIVDDDESQVTSPFKTVLSAPSIVSYSTLSAISLPSQHNEPPVRPKSTAKSPNRQRLLAKVRSYWITGLLEQSLYGAGLIALGLQKQAEAVVNPWRLVLQQSGLTPQRLPVGTHITEAYDDADGALLILGEPGSGKTTLLLELTRDLLYRAEQDETHPMPVVFNLSSWAATQQPITSWLTEELNSKYQVPRKLAKGWVESDQILPLLDGFDEVALTARGPCLDAINAYRKEHGLLPTVVCSRSADYFAQKSSILLSSAVMVQPLTDQQVDDYLESGGEPLWALRVALHEDPALRELTTTPLMLSILTLTYHDMPVEDLLQEASLTERQRKVFEHYVERMLKRRGANPMYTPQQTRHWLSWLARQLTQHNQSIFYMERMQPDWLSESGSHRHYPRLSVGLIFGLLGSLGFGPTGWMLFPNLYESSRVQPPFGLSLGFILLFGLVSGSLFGLLNAFLYKQEAERKLIRGMRWSWKRTLRRIVKGVLNGLLIGLLFGVPYGLALGLQQGSPFLGMLSIGVLVTLLGGVGFGLLERLLDIQTAQIQSAETFAWSWASMGRNLVKFLLLGLLGSLLIGLLLGLFSGLYDWVTNRTVTMLSVVQGAWLVGLQFVQVITPFFVLIGGLFGGVAGGLSNEIIDERNLTTPNQGIRRSARHSVFVGIVGLLIGGITAGLLGGIVSRQHDPNLLWHIILTYGLVIGPLIGLISGLRGGGIACIQHFILRLLLKDAGVMPWNYPRFLDYAAERILLRKVGGGYIFTHRLLLDYFVTLDSTAVPPHTQIEQRQHVQRQTCECGHLEDRSGSKFCPKCGRAKT
ncbi:MAG: hypothetical protein PVS3B3_29280 [Ktedonobacteraceae bacterium]